MRLVLCDYNRILCEALASAMQRCGHQVVAITTTVADGLVAVQAHRPDVVLLDPGTPARAGEACCTEEAAWLGAAAALRQQHPDTAVLLLSGLVDRARWSAAKQLGVAGYLSKNQNLGQVVAALDAIAAGRLAFDPAVPSLAGPDRPSRRRSARPYRLTPREKEVLRRIVAGQGTPQMAREMNIAADTLRSYVKSVLAELGAHTRLQAAALATREDVLDELSA
jgi:two-component system, NarL family, nitrate/nitrite response regulator NarL